MIRYKIILALSVMTVGVASAQQVQAPGAFGTPAAPQTGAQINSQPAVQQQQPQNYQQRPQQPQQQVQAQVRTAPPRPPRLPVPIMPPTTREVVGAMVDEAVDTVLLPSEVGRIKDRVQSVRQRQVTPSYPGNTMPKPISRSISVSPDPAAQPKMVRLSAATITSVVFSDISGNPWMIESKSFDPGSFSDGVTGCGQQGGQASEKPQRPTNILNLQPCDPYSYGNVVVTLKGFNAPVVFMLSTGRSKEVDVRISARVNGRNPDAMAEVVVSENLPDHDNAMQYFLDGVPPPGAKALKAKIGQAWMYGGAMYYRTRHQLYAPAFQSHVGSAEGMHVYKFRRVEPYVTVSNSGQADVVTINGY